MEITELLQNHSEIYLLNISHVISKQFGPLFNSDCVEPEIIANLKVSQGSADENHEKYVSELIKITSDRQNIMDKTKLIRNHILWAKEESLKDDEDAQFENKEYKYLNLPSDESKILDYIDNDLLRDNGLIAPEDVLTLKKNHLNINNGKNSIPDMISNENSTKIKETVQCDIEEFRLPRIENPQNKNNKKKISKCRSVEIISLKVKEENNFAIEMMKAKNNYMKNPRFLTLESSNDSRAWLIQTSKDLHLKQIFLPIPEMLEFSDYEVGKVYQRLINFRNMTTVLRPIRILPPKTKYFSIGLGQFPGEKGLVAPGMSCQYPVRFSPDSLGDYEDEITIETPDHKSFLVKLISHRPRPILTGSTLWNMKSCLIYGIKIMHYKIKNIGGPGKFCIVDSNIPPTNNSKAIIQNLQVVIEPFLIRPGYFELHTNESINLEIIFCPDSLGQVEKEFIIICDNCHAETFKITGNGEVASISIENIEGGTSIPDLDEYVDISAKTFLKFQPLHPLTFYQKTIVLKNENHQDISFSWKIVKPILRPSYSSDSDDMDLNILKTRTLDFDSSFLIEPQSGIFPANQTLTFVITFAPSEVKMFHSVLHFVLQDIPDFKSGQSFNSNTLNECMTKQKFATRNNEGFIETQNCTSSTNNFKINAVSLNDVTGLEIEVKGNCIPLQIRFCTPSIIIPGKLLINTLVRKQLQIINESMCPVNLIWKTPDSEDYIFDIEPRLCFLNSEEIGTVDVCILANKPGFFRDTLLCYAESLEKPLELIVEAYFKGPDLEIDINDLNFGLVKVNESYTKVLNLFNKTSISCSWQCRIDSTEDNELFKEIIISPERGILKPLNSEKLSVTFTPRFSKDVDCRMEIAIENSHPKYLNILSSAQSPKVTLKSTFLDVTGELFINTPSTFIINMVNQSLIQSKFEWQNAVTDLSDIISIICEPSHGTIEPNDFFDVKLIITCASKTELGDIFLSCLVEGMDEAIVMKISGTVLGPDLTYHIFDNIEDAQNEQKLSESMKGNLNLKNDMMVFENVKKYILIINKTSILTEFHVSVNYFKTSLENLDSVNKIITKRPNLADRQSKPEKLMKFGISKSKLKLKNGLAVDFNPPCGKLRGYDKVLVEVTFYNDMWGRYKDFVKISGIAEKISTDPILIPLDVNVVGIPIEFTMTAGRQEQRPILRLGTKSLGDDLFSRRIRLNNKSCCDIFINWEMYKKVKDSDEQIIDLIVTIGDAFPINAEPVKSLLNKDLDSERSVRLSNPCENNHKINLVQNSDYNSDDENLISVVIRPFDGQMSYNPLRFEPSQLLIPAESYGFVTIFFDPQYSGIAKDLEFIENKMINFENFLLGFLSLNKEDLRTGMNIFRSDKYLISHIKLDITARILMPSLQIEYPDSVETELYFSSPFSNLLEKCESKYSLSNKMIFTSFVILRNVKDTDIKYSLKTFPPFEIADKNQAEEREIKIGESVKIVLKFILDKQYVSLLKDETLYHLDDHQCSRIENQIISNEITDRTSKMIQFRNVLTVTYRNTEFVEYIPIRAQIYFPEFILSKSVINFEVCSVGEVSIDHFRIINKSKSTSMVYLRIDNSSDKVFEFNPSCGLIPSNLLDTEKNYINICVRFMPKQAVEYSANLIIEGIMGEETVIIPIKAKGSYDDQYKKEY